MVPHSTTFDNFLSFVIQSLKQFNLALLTAFEKKGLTKFKGLIYKPFGNNISFAEVIRWAQVL